MDENRSSALTVKHSVHLTLISPISSLTSTNQPMTMIALTRNCFANHSPRKMQENQLYSGAIIRKIFDFIWYLLDLPVILLHITHIHDYCHRGFMRTDVTQFASFGLSCILVKDMSYQSFEHHSYCPLFLLRYHHTLTGRYHMPSRLSTF